MDKQRRVCVGETDRDQIGADGMGVMFCDEPCSGEGCLIDDLR